MLQPFGSLLSIARGLASSQPKPSDRQTGDPVTNLYLVLCAMDQILSDYLHRHFYDFDRASFSPAVRRTLALASRVERSARRAWVHAAHRHLISTEDVLSRLSRSVARRILDGKATPAPMDVAAIARLAGMRYPASLSESLLKLPQAFRGVDLYPEDCALLARRALALAAGDDTPVAVIGLRTSGLYMAPLCAAAIDRLGHPDVGLFSVRPGIPTLLHEERRLRKIAAAGGWALVVDDPTWRGWAFAKVLDGLKELGYGDDRLRLTACEIGNQPVFRLGDAGASSDTDMPDVWTGFESAQKVVLQKGEWRVLDHLSDEAAGRCLNRREALARLGASRITVRRGHPFTETGEPPGVTGTSIRRRQRRFHIQKVFQVDVERNGETSTELVVGRGVGIGFFGYHSSLVAQALAGQTPKLLGLENGILFTRWEAGPHMEAGRVSSKDVDALAGYVSRRAEALRFERRWRRAPETRAVYSGARQVARTLGRSMGGVGALAQFRAAEALSCLLAPPHPAVIDGRMRPDEWVRSGSGIVKTDFEEHGFDITDRLVTDPVHDLAAASVCFHLDATSERQLVECYEQLTGDHDRLRARMAFHKVMAGVAALEGIKMERGEPVSPAERQAFARDLVNAEQALTRTINGYLADLYIAGPASRGSGDVWAIDLDDSLETDRLGFQATSPAGARALRMLRAHDQLVIASTGRSLAEVQDRCETYGLAGGIAEYGAVAWDARRRISLPIASDQAKRRLAELRRAIIDETDIVVDPLYEHSLRLFRHTPDGRRGMKVEEINELIDRHGIRGLEVVEGFRKTVVWATGSNKANALNPLLESLGIDITSRKLHVIGDEFTDLELMARADRRHAPANASAAVRERASELSINLASRTQAAGVLEAVHGELHRSRGGCSVCRRVALDRSDRVLVELLGVQDRSRASRLAFALHPASLRAFEL